MIFITEYATPGDTATMVGKAFMGEFREWLVGENIYYTSLVQDAANRDNWETALATGKITSIAHIGHGSDTVITGIYKAPLIAVGQYDPKLYENLGFHFLSCKSGKTLIPDMVDKAAIFGCGYDETYTFYYSGGDPLNDGVARAFFEPHLELDRQTLLGITAEEAFNISQKMYKSNADALRPINPMAASAMLYDMQHHVWFGDGSWTPGNGAPDHKIVRVELVPKDTGTDVEFNVSNAKTDESVENATVLLGMMEEQTDPEGVCWFRKIPNGEYPWTVTHEDFELAEGSVTIP